MPGEGGAASRRRNRFAFKVPEERTTQPRRGKDCQECRLKYLSAQRHEGASSDDEFPVTTARVSCGVDSIKWESPGPLTAPGYRPTTGRRCEEPGDACPAPRVLDRKQ